MWAFFLFIFGKKINHQGTLLFSCHYCKCNLKFKNNNKATNVA